MELPCFIWKTHSNHLHSLCSGLEGPLMVSYVVQVNQTPLGVWSVPLRIARLAVKWWLVGMSELIHIHEFLNTFLSLEVDCQEFSKLRNSPLEYLMEAGWITSSVFTNPQTLHTDLSRSILAESLRTLWTCAQGQGWMVRGVVVVVGRTRVGSSANRGLVQPNSVMWSPGCRGPGRLQSLAQRLPGSSEERPI